MSKFLSTIAAVVALASLAAPAFAQSPVTFVSGRGTDAGNCAAPASPCRTFQYALGLTNAGGEIKALDPANYFSVFINKSINITGVEGAGIVRGTAGNAITISAGANGAVSLSNLTIDGVNATAAEGVKVNAAARLTVRHCTVRNFQFSGIALTPTTALTFLITESVATDNAAVGVLIFPQGAGSAQGTLDRVISTRNNVGVQTTTSGSFAGVTVVDSIANDNIQEGISIFAGTTLRLSHSTATRNAVGVSVSGTGRSAGNNFINGNTAINVSGALTNDGTQ